MLPVINVVFGLMCILYLIIFVEHIGHQVYKMKMGFAWCCFLFCYNMLLCSKNHLFVLHWACHVFTKSVQFQSLYHHFLFSLSISQLQGGWFKEPSFVLPWTWHIIRKNVWTNNVQVCGTSILHLHYDSCYAIFFISCRSIFCFFFFYFCTPSCFMGSCQEIIHEAYVSILLIYQ